MFRGMYPIFWVGIVFMYGFALFSMMVEMITNTGTVQYQIGSIPVPFIYVMFLMMWVVPMIVALLWWWVPKKAKEERDRQQQGKEG